MSPMTVPPLGERIRQARLARGVSLRSLAREVGVSASLISQIETGKSQPSVGTLYGITTALGISVEELFDAPDRGPATPRPGNPATPDTDLDTDPAGPDRPGAGSLGPGTLGRETLGQAVLDPGGPDAATATISRAAAQAGQTGTVPGALGALAALAADPVRRVGPIVRPAQRDVLQLDSGVVWERLGRIPGTAVDFLLVTYAPGGSSSSTDRLMRHPGAEYGYLLEGELVLTLGFDEHHLHPGDAVCFESSTPHRYRNDGERPAVGVWFVAEHETRAPD